MDCSYIEEDSIHIMVPYSSEPRWGLNRTNESIDEGEHQISRPFEPNQIDESEFHHHFIPRFKIIPSKSDPPSSRPNTLIVSIPLKKHLLDESSFAEDEEESEGLIINQSLSYYGKTGIILYKTYQCESNLENKIIEEFLNDPQKLAEVVEECKEFIVSEQTMLSKIVVDLLVEFWRDRDMGKLKEWVGIGIEFYSGLSRPIHTNFVVQGILHYDSKNEYLEYLNSLLG